MTDSEFETNDFEGTFEQIKEKVQDFLAKHLQHDTAQMNNVNELKELLPKVNATYYSLTELLNTCLADSTVCNTEQIIQDNTYTIDTSFVDSLKTLLEELCPLMCTNSLHMHALCSNLFHQLRTNGFSPNSSYR